MTWAPFILAPEAKALAETGCAGAPRPGKIGTVVDETGVDAGVGVGCEGVGVDIVSTRGFSSSFSSLVSSTSFSSLGCVFSLAGTRKMVAYE